MAVDGVLLMADMLVLGPGEKVHVQMPDLAEPLYLFRQKDRLGGAVAGEFTVEGEKVKIAPVAGARLREFRIVRVRARSAGPLDFSLLSA